MARQQSVRDGLQASFRVEVAQADIERGERRDLRRLNEALEVAEENRQREAAAMRSLRRIRARERVRQHQRVLGNRDERDLAKQLRHEADMKRTEGGDAARQQHKQRALEDIEDRLELRNEKVAETLERSRRALLAEEYFNQQVLRAAAADDKKYFASKQASASGV
jgi:hypothetical protein